MLSSLAEAHLVGHESILEHSIKHLDLVVSPAMFNLLWDFVAVDPRQSFCGSSTNA